MAYRYITGIPREEFYDIAAGAVIDHVQNATTMAGHANLLLSGGSTPAPVYERVSQVDLPWDKINVGLVDERWVDENDTGSNAALIRRTLLKESPTRATFTPMKTSALTPQAGQSDVETRYASLVSAQSLAILGMGADGHVCSWFPKSQGLDVAVDLKNDQTVQAVRATRSKVTGEYLDRMTLTLSALLRCRTLLLLITGDEKRRILERAMTSNTPDLPVSALLNAADMGGGGDRLTILHGT